MINGIVESRVYCILPWIREGTIFKLSSYKEPALLTNLRISIKVNDVEFYAVCYSLSIDLKHMNCGSLYSLSSRQDTPVLYKSQVILHTQL